MPNCSAKGCGIKKGINQPNISLHRLPKNDQKRKMWLDRIGVDNIKTGTKSIFVCSLHFEESCFNRTLNITALRDDAVPTRFFFPSAQSRLANAAKELDHQYSIAPKCETLDKIENVGAIICQDPISITSEESTPYLPVQDTTLKTKKTSNIKCMHCKEYKKKIKILNQKIRRQKKQIQNMKIKNFNLSHLVNAEHIAVLKDKLQS